MMKSEPQFSNVKFEGNFFSALDTWRKIGPFADSDNFIESLRSEKDVVYGKHASDHCSFAGILYGERKGYGRHLVVENNLRILEGHFTKNKLGGKGRIIYNNGSYYIGEVLNNTANGQG